MRRRQRNRDALYDDVEPVLPLGLPFVQTAVSEGLVRLAGSARPVSGVVSRRQDQPRCFSRRCRSRRLKARVADYFDAALSHEEIARLYMGAMKSSSGFVVRDARSVRDALLERSGPIDNGFIRFAYRPFDNRWLYWEAGHGLLGRPVPDYHASCVRGEYLVGYSAALGLAPRLVELTLVISKHIGDLNQMNSAALILCPNVA